MKKIIAVIALMFAIVSCGANTNNKVSTTNSNTAPSDMTTEETVEVTQTEEAVDLTPDEEKIVEELLK